MSSYADKTSKSKDKGIDSGKQRGGKSTFHLTDNRPKAIAQRKLQEAITNSPTLKKGKNYQAGTTGFTSQPAQQKQEPSSSSPANTPVIQARLIIGDDDILPSEILKNGPGKKGIDKAISRRIQGLGIKPLPVRTALATLARSDNINQFPSMREAIEKAIVMSRNQVSEDDVANIEQGEDAAHAAMLNHPATKDFPKPQIWRLLLDGKHQASRGKFGFENEKGYMGAMTNSFAGMLGTIGTPLDTAMYENFHDQAVAGVNDRSGEPMEAGYRANPAQGEGFGLDMDNWSPAGHAEMKAKFQQRPHDPVGSMMASHPDKMIKRSADESSLDGRQEYRVRPTNSRQHAQDLAHEVINRYHGEITAANQIADVKQQKDAKLTAIARICQDLDQLHLFTDGNIRTIVFLVLNKLMIEEGFTPVILEEPNAFDGKSVEELKVMIKKGQRTYNSYLPKH